VEEDRAGERPGLIGRLAAAPISWGVCEVPGWGLQLPVPRVLAEMRELGLRATELGAIGWLPTEPGELRDVLATYELRVVGSFVPLALHDPDRKQETLETASEMASLLEEVGGQYFVTAAVSDLSDWGRPVLTATEWAHLIDMLSEVEGITIKHGVRQVLHPHVDTLVETAEELERVLDSSSVSLCLDTGHVTIGGADPVDLAERFAPRVGLVHLKDVRSSIADRLNAGELSLMAAVQAGLFVPLGEGDVPIAETITSLERQGYDGVYVLEQDAAITDGQPPPGEGPVRDVAKSVAFLRSLQATLSVTVGSGEGSAVAGSTSNHDRENRIPHS
jgi:inosose dehydratase